jgi:AraC family transcriptional regulator, regulatory protein of adaptative response / methylated-DNA-[protein]-cysteine methyltransferase
MSSPDVDTKTRLQRSRAYSSDDARWEAVRRRDRAADGVFYCAVRTTGVYCRPSCAARPHRENVSFHATAAEAERAGFRPCKRCRPNEAAPEPGASRAPSIAARVSSLDWERIASDLDADGCAITGTVLTPQE